MSFPDLLLVPNAVAGLLRVTGDDAFAYLQSQFSNDLRRPGIAHPATYGLWLTRKGKVAADSLAVRLGDNEILLLAFHTPADKLEEKVLENVIADDVTTSVPSWPVFTAAGSGSGALLISLGLPVPEPGTFAIDSDILVVASRRGPAAYELIDRGPVPTLAARIAKTNTPMAGPDALEAPRLLAGVPRVPEDCGPGDLPQEAGLDSDAVSFSKGCYLGQEVMARLQAQGRANRVLTRIIINKDVAANAGDKLYAGDSEAGEIRSKIATGAGCVAMAMLRIRVAETVETFSTTPGGAPAATRFPAS